MFSSSSYVVVAADSAVDPNRPLICVFDKRDDAREFCRANADKGYDFIPLPRNPDFKSEEKKSKPDLEELKPDLKMPIKDPKPRDLPSMDPFAVRPVAEKPQIRPDVPGVAFPGPFTKF